LLHCEGQRMRKKATAYCHCADWQAGYRCCHASSVRQLQAAECCWWVVCWCAEGHHSGRPQWDLNRTVQCLVFLCMFYTLLLHPDSIVMSVSVCVSVCVCVFVRDHIFGTTRPIFTKFFVHVTDGRGSVLLWRHSDTLHIFQFAEVARCRRQAEAVRLIVTCRLGLGA